MKAIRILMVEDETIVAMDIEERIARMGYELAGHATTGQTAIDLTMQLRPDVVLMDIRLQGSMDGITAGAEIYRCFSSPVIFLTAHSDDETLARAKLVSPYSYLIKPFKDSDLKSAIEIAHHKYGADREINRLNRLLDVLGQVNKTVLHCRSREELFAAACRLVVERGKVDIAWIGWHDPVTARITPVASFGDGANFLSAADFWADGRPEGQANPGKAVREGRPSCCNECLNAFCPYPIDQKPARFGFQSCGSFPLRFRAELWGAISLCNAEPHFFQEGEIRLMEEVASGISFALDKIDADARALVLMESVAAARDGAERDNRSLQQSEQHLKSLLGSMNDLVFVLDQDRVFQEYHAPDALELLLGSESFLGKSFDRIGFPKPAFDIIKQTLDQTEQTRSLNQAEYFLDMPDGRRWYDLRVTPLHRQMDRPTSVTCVVRNITDQHQRRELMAVRARLLDLACNQTMEALLLAMLDEAELITGSRISFFHFVEPDQVTLTLQVWSTNTQRNMCRAERPAPWTTTQGCSG